MLNYCFRCVTGVKQLSVILKLTQLKEVNSKGKKQENKRQFQNPSPDSSSFALQLA